MSSTGGGIREDWRDGWRESLLIIAFGAIGVVGALLGDVLGPVLVWVIPIAAIAGVIVVLVVYKRRKANEAAAQRAETLARVLAEAAATPVTPIEAAAAPPVTLVEPAPDDSIR